MHERHVQSWFLLEHMYQGYKRRFSQEHGYRFDKQALLDQTTTQNSRAI